VICDFGLNRQEANGSWELGKGIREKKIILPSSFSPR
jgi:hypothetical protein